VWWGAREERRARVLSKQATPTGMLIAGERERGERGKRGEREWKGERGSYL
jgi:hypothetical protein